MRNVKTLWTVEDVRASAKLCMNTFFISKQNQTDYLIIKKRKRKELTE